MNRIERISAILIQLQSKKIVKGQEIADRFGISLRTVYRDIKTLEEAGVPILSEAGIGYQVMEGYRLPPVMFTKEEATALITAEKLMAQYADNAALKMYQSAIYKIKSVLRSDDKDYVENIHEHLEIVDNPYAPKTSKPNDTMQFILDSITTKKVLAITYSGIHSQAQTTRMIEPVGMYLMNGKWYLIAFCLLRNDYRNFRTDKILQIKPTQQAFAKQHPSLKKYLQATVQKEQGELHTVVICASNTISKHLHHQKYYNGFVAEKTGKENTEMTFLTAHLNGFARWFLMFADSAEIIAPTELKTKVDNILNQITTKHSKK